MSRKTSRRYSVNFKKNLNIKIMQAYDFYEYLLFALYFGACTAMVRMNCVYGALQ
jgi:hypothetical protein